jgi:hypothetical protein
MAQLTRKVKRLTGSETLNQVEHIDEVGARAVMGDVLAPGIVITSDTSAAGVLVGKGSILRVQATADTYIAFGTDAIGAVSSTTSPGFKHPGGYVLLNATDDFIRSSANVTRLEILHRG